LVRPISTPTTVAVIVTGITPMLPLRGRTVVGAKPPTGGFVVSVINPALDPAIAFAGIGGDGSCDAHSDSQRRVYPKRIVVPAALP